MNTHTANPNSIGRSTHPAAQPGDYKTVTVNGCQLAYLERGYGDAVIFVHGGICDLRIWERQIDAFAENHRAIAYSRRYAWPNDDIPDGVDDQMWPHIEDLAQVIRKLNAAPAHLVGNSWGGFICLLTALRYPELVRSLAVEEPAVLPLFVSSPPKPQEMLKLFATRPRTGGALMKFFATGIGPAISAFKKGDFDRGLSIFARGVLGADVYESLPADVKEQMRANGKALKAQLLGAGLPAFTDADVRRIQNPTLLISGEKSPALLVRMTDRLQELLPNAQRISIPGASHVMHYEQPAAVNAAVLGFIANH